jgi:membrane protein implicated in regulation of membrane protease activity
VGLLAAVRVAEAAWAQWLLFSLLSVASLLVFRGPLLARMRPAIGPGSGDYLGEVAVLLDDLPVGAVGKAELRGTTWSVRSDEPRPLARGQRCRVVRVEGLLLWVRPEAV